MSASTSLYRPTLAALRALIETPQNTPWDEIAERRVVNKCDQFCDQYSELFFDHHIDHIELYKWTHTCLAIHTSDEGIVLFDPTIRQFYPDYPEHYFLGHAQELVDYIDGHGTWEGLVENDPEEPEPITARDAYWEMQITHCMLHEIGYDPLKRARYQQEWSDALKPIFAGDRDASWTRRVCQPPRSKSEVSP